MSVCSRAVATGIRGLQHFRRGLATSKSKNLLGTELTLQSARPWAEAAEDGFAGTSLDSIFADKKVVVVGVPGAFTGTCSSQHIPQYIAEFDVLKGQGVDDLICDPYSMYAWGQGLFVMNKINMYADPDGSFTRWMDQEIDLSAAALGCRSNRYSMLVDNGQILELNAENSPSEVKVSAVASTACNELVCCLCKVTCFNKRANHSKAGTGPPNITLGYKY